MYLNKEKVQNLITQQRINLADVSYLDLNSINNVIQNFENPSIKEEKNAKRKEIKFTEKGITYTLVTASKGDFRSFYSNKKAPGEVNSQKAGSASSPEHRDNIPQLSENASQADGNGQKRTETDGRFSVSPVWTGSAADYDQPSLQFKR